MAVLGKIATLVEVRLSKAFGKLGWWVAERPFLTIALCFVLAAALASGIPSIESETAPENLYAPSGNLGQKTLDRMDELFSATYSSQVENTLIVYSDDKRNLYTAEVLNGIYSMVQDLEQLEIESNGMTYTWSTLCAKSFQAGFEGTCEFRGVSDLMAGPVDAATLPVINANITTDVQGGFQVTALFAGGRTLNADNTAVVGVEAWKVFLTLDAQDTETYDASWELSNAMFEYLEQKASTLDENSPFQIAYEMEFSQAEELEKSTNGDVGLLSITFTLVITFSFLVVRSYSDFVLSKGNVVWGAQLGIVLAIASAFGLMGHLGVKFNPVVSTTAFLLLGLGVDDAYVMIQAYHNTARYLGPEATIQERISRTFESAGVSIFFTSITDTLAFAVGATSVFPAVRAFCAYTATGVAFDFLFQVLLFGAVLAVDAHREYCGKSEIAACGGHGWLRAATRYNPNKTLVEDGKGPPGGSIPVMPEVAFLQRTMKAYGARLLSPALAAAVMLIFCGYWAFAVVGVLKVGTGLDLRDLAPSDSYWTVFVNTNFDYFMEKGPTYELAFPPDSLDWTSPKERASALALVAELEDMDCLFVEPRGVFLREFYDAAPHMSNLSLPSTLPELEGAAFTSALGWWLESPAGSEYREDVIMDEEEGEAYVWAARMRVRMEPLSTTSGDKEGVPCMQDSRKVVEAWGEAKGKAGDAAPFLSLFSFRFWDSSAVIVEQTALNMLYAAVCCFVVTLVILPHPVLCFLAMLVVASILAGVVAAMALILDIRIETISMIDLVMSIGFSIDNVAHYCHAFMISRETTTRDKAIDALQVIGIPILLGDASTMVALLPLLGSKSRIFRSFFYILFTVLLLGALHAIVLLPVLLGYVGPLPHYTEREAHGGNGPGNDDDGAGIEAVAGKEEGGGENPATGKREVEEKAQSLAGPEPGGGGRDQLEGSGIAQAQVQTVTGQGQWPNTVNLNEPSGIATPNVWLAPGGHAPAQPLPGSGPPSDTVATVS